MDSLVTLRTCEASLLAFGSASVAVGFELGLGGIKPEKARVGRARRMRGVRQTIDGRRAGRIARHLEAPVRESRGGIVNGIAKLSLAVAAQKYFGLWDVVILAVYFRQKHHRVVNYGERLYGHGSIAVSTSTTGRNSRLHVNLPDLEIT